MARSPEGGLKSARDVLGVGPSASPSDIERAFLECVARARYAFMRLGGFEAPRVPAHHTFDDFAEGPCNQLALASLRALLDHKNPQVLLHGKCGLGKTHLLGALWRALRTQRPDDLVLFTTGETFTNELVGAVASHTLELFRARYRQVDVLLLDGIEFLSNRFRTQEELQCVLDELSSRSGQVVITATSAAHDLEGFTDSFRSRLASGTVVELRYPDLETRKAIVRRIFGRLGIEAPRDVVFRLAQRIRTDARALEGAVSNLAACHAVRPQAWEGQSLDDLLHDVPLAGPREDLGLDEIKERVSSHFGLEPLELEHDRANGNTKVARRARQVALYLCRTLTQHSLQEIGDAFGASTRQVLYAVRAVKEKDDPGTLKDLERLREKLDPRRATARRGTVSPPLSHPHPAQAKVHKP